MRKIMIASAAALLAASSSVQAAEIKALITTAVGLSVAIPAFIFYKFLQSRVDRLVVEMEERSLRLVNLVSQQSGNG